MFFLARFAGWILLGYLHPVFSFRFHRSEENFARLSRQQAAMAWKDNPGVDDGTSYSVIVVECNHHASNLFRDKSRVRAYVPVAHKNRVDSVQFANPFPQDNWNSSVPPFYVAHPLGVDKRVRIVHMDFMDHGSIDDFQVGGYYERRPSHTHLKRFLAMPYSYFGCAQLNGLVVDKKFFNGHQQQIRVTRCRLVVK